MCFSLLREVTQAAREVLPDSYPLWVVISATDWIEHGWDIEQSVALSDKLKPLGVDLIDCSSGGISQVPKCLLDRVTKLGLPSLSDGKQASQPEQLV
jgi:2,4-dienoyl-CoA reductase-like NADH-dependent reductase (Old Yellow Enzyme family)